MSIPELRELLSETAARPTISVDFTDLGCRARRRRRSRRISRTTAVIASALAAVLVVGAVYDQRQSEVVSTRGQDARRAPGWHLLSAGPLSARDQQAVAWTGKEMIVWGGEQSGDGGPLSDGAAFNPARDSWRLLPKAPLTPRADPLAVWTGKEVVFWGGSVNGEPRSDGAAFNPSQDSWRSVPKAPSTLGAGVAATWTGKEMIIWGGRPGGRIGFDNLAAAAAYNATSNSWRTLPAPPVGLSYASAMWTGTEAIFWGGVVADRSTNLFVGTDGARYDPVANAWYRLPPSGLNAQASVAVWAERQVVALSYDLAVRTYDPRNRTWTPRPRVPHRSVECYPKMTAAGHSAFINYCGTAAMFRADGSSIVLPAPPSNRRGAQALFGSPVWTGTEVVFWGTQYNGKVNNALAYVPQPP